MSLLTTTLMKHLNIGQRVTIDTSDVFMSLETATVAALSNKSIVLAENASVHIPFDFRSNCLNNSSAVALRVRRPSHQFFVFSSLNVGCVRTSCPQRIISIVVEYQSISIVDAVRPWSKWAGSICSSKPCSSCSISNSSRCEFCATSDDLRECHRWHSIVASENARHPTTANESESDDLDSFRDSAVEH